MGGLGKVQVLLLLLFLRKQQGQEQVQWAPRSRNGLEMVVCVGVAGGSGGQKQTREGGL